MKYLVTSIKRDDWKDFGKSWISSSLNYSGIKENEIIVFTNDSKIKNELEKISIKSFVFNFETRLEVFLKICEYSKTQLGSYAYWDSCVFFQKDITSIFEEKLDRFFISQSKDLSFVFAKDCMWNIFEKIKLSTEFYNPSNFDSFFIKNYSHIISCLSEEWNFVDSNCLDNIDGCLKYGTVIPKAINVGSFKKNLIGKNILYYENHKDELENLFKKKIFTFKNKKR